LSEEYKRWEARYSAPDYIFGKEPNYFLAKCKPLLPASGRVLAVADGEGRNSVWLAEQGLDVHAIDFLPAAQDKARALARECGVNVIFELADVHNWAYPEAAYDVVCEIFTQFSTPAERALKWAGMRKALKPGGLLIIQGYTPKQLAYGTGGAEAARPTLHKAHAGKGIRRLQGHVLHRRRVGDARRHVAWRHVGGDRVNRSKAKMMCQSGCEW
jgi:2-polyprenyl-3-methyl-5-hydroxy-6-metoxy-1,4-benzoquinol methylase